MPITSATGDSPFGSLIEQLRGSRKNRESLERKREFWGNMTQSAGPAVTQGPSTRVSVAGRQAEIPSPATINYGDIAMRGLGMYNVAKTNRQIDENEELNNVLSSQFMQTSLQSDPQLQRLMELHMAGVPGMEKAIGQYMAPKKESMGAFLQYIQSGAASPEGAAAIAEKFGIDPTVGQQMADTATQLMQQKEERKWNEKVALKQMGISAADRRAAMNSGAAGGYRKEFVKAAAKVGLSPEEFADLPQEERIRLATQGGRETAESKELGKMRAAAIQELPLYEDTVNRVRDLAKMADKATWMPMGLGLAPAQLGNPNNAMLMQGLDQLALDAAGGKLGAGVSNADREFLLSATANFKKGNKDTAVAQLKNFLSRIEIKRNQARAAMGKEPEDVKMDDLPKSRVEYSSTKNRGRKSFDELWKEAGGE